MTTNSSITGEQVVESSNPSQHVQQNREHSTSQDNSTVLVVEEVQNSPNIDASNIQIIENRNISELERQEVPEALSIVDSEQQTLQQAANTTTTIDVSEQNRQETIVHRNAEGQQLQEITSDQMILGAVPEAVQTVVTLANVDIVQ